MSAVSGPLAGKPVAAIVDDDRRIVESLVELLESAGYEARGFASAAGLLAAGLADLQVLVTDIGMPGLDGFALQRRVAAARPELPVFFISGRDGFAGDPRLARARGFFRKPFDAIALLGAIEAAIATNEEEDET